MEKLLLLSDIYMPAIALLVYLALWKSIQKKEWPILVYLIVNIVLFTITDVLAGYHIHNMPFYHFYSIFEAWFLSWYILKKITGKNSSPAFWIIGTAYTVFFVINVAFLENISEFNSNSAGVTSLLVLFLSMYYLLNLSKSEEILFFQRLPSFWIISGFLIFNAISILVSLSYKYFSYENANHYADNLWFLSSFANIIKFALISTGILCYYKRRPITHSPFLL